MKQQLFAALASGALLMGAFAPAKAGQGDASFHINLDIEANCSLLPFGGNTLNVAANTYWAAGGAPFAVHCSDMLPYSLELDTLNGGRLDVTDSTTNRTYQVKFNKPDGSPWSTEGNGEDYTGVGTGFIQPIDGTIHFNEDNAYGAPQVGTYLNTLNAMLSF